MKLVCASANPDKVAEIAAILDDRVELLPRPDDVADVVEDADTLVGNARLKAVAIRDATGLAAVADDTGLEVEALGGAPGVYSARYAGDDASYADNRTKLLHELGATEQRSARFRTVVVVAFNDGDELIAEGVCEGAITGDERGSSGFGYDSIFAPTEAGGRTFAEMSEADKHAMSHRGRALRHLLELLDERRIN